MDDTVERMRRLAAALGTTIGELLGDPAPAAPLRAGDWIVDLDQFDQALVGQADPAGSWAFPIPSRLRIVDSSEVDRLEARVNAAPRPPRRRKKPS